MNRSIKGMDKGEPYDVDRIKESIRRASREARIKLERANELIRFVSEHGSEMAEEGSRVSFRDIRKKILDELDAQEPDMDKAWEEYEKIKPFKK